MQSFCQPFSILGLEISVLEPGRIPLHLKISYNKPAFSSFRPYLLLAIAALLAYLPVSSMMFSLKNDVLAIEYPFLHFISESLRNGDAPLWFNTWCMGFPVQSVLTWGIYSTPVVVAGTLMPVDVYVLHIIFLFFVITSGWAMFKLLTTHFLPSRDLSLLLSCCYMLSGFTSGSSQWLLYITGMTFIPVVLLYSLNLLKKPSVRNAFFLGLAYFLLLTNTHIYLTAFTSYFLVFFFLFNLGKKLTGKQISAEQKKKLLIHTVLAILIIFLLCAAPIYYTIETVSYLERSNPLEETSAFFRSNYLHPAGLKSLLFPLSTVRSYHFNTEGSIQNSYLGLLSLILFVPSVIRNARNKNKEAWGLLLLSLFLLVLSFGHLTPLREWLNILPGLSHFRHPGVLRVFFIMAFIVYLGFSFKGIQTEDILKQGTTEGNAFRYSLGMIILFSLAIVIVNAGFISGTWKGSLHATVKNIGHEQLVLLNSIMQLIFASLLLFASIRIKRFFPVLIFFELILNFLFTTPFYAVSSSPVQTVNRILERKKGFPVQQSAPFNVPAELRSEGETVWRNSNTFQKEVSVNVSMPGPLILEPVAQFIGSPEKNKLASKELVFLKDPSDSSALLSITGQKPSRVGIRIKLGKPNEVVLQQGRFPGWKAYYNGRELPLHESEFPFVSVIAPAGEGELVFIFKKEKVVYSAALLHIIVIASLLFLLFRKLFIRFSSPSSPN